MRRILFTMCAAAGITAAAQDANVLSVTCAGSNETMQVALSEIDCIKFNAEDGSVCITTRDGDQTVLLEESAWSAVFAFREQEEDAVEAPEAVPEAMEVWSLSGQKMRSTVGALPHGVYVVKSSGKARKITL